MLAGMWPAARYVEPRPSSARTRVGAPHLELHRLPFMQAPKPLGKQVTLRGQTASEVPGHKAGQWGHGRAPGAQTRPRRRHCG